MLFILHYVVVYHNVPPRKKQNSRPSHVQCKASYFQGIHQVLDEEEPPQFFKGAVHIEVQAVRVLLNLLLGKGDLKLQVGPVNKPPPQRTPSVGTTEQLRFPSFPLGMTAGHPGGQLCQPVGCRAPSTPTASALGDTRIMAPSTVL